MRADEASMRSGIGAFADAMQTASAYCVYEKGEGTGMYQVETRIRRLLPF
jgi:capsid protein